jgi:hypothetical protein
MFVRDGGDVSADGVAWTIPQTGSAGGGVDDSVAYGTSGWLNTSYSTIYQTVGGSVPYLYPHQQIQGIVGQNFQYELSAGASSYLALQLPPGLSLNATTGVISGTPTTAGTYQVFIYAANVDGYGNYATSIITISN